MITLDWLQAFYATILDDSRLNATLISVYLSIVFEGLHHEPEKEFEIERLPVMQRAKINSFTTYNKALHDLHDFGYIRYKPMPGRIKSRIALRKL